MSTLTNDIKVYADFKSPNPDYTSSVNVHGWSNKKNTYLFDTKVCVRSFRKKYII